MSEHLLRPELKTARLTLRPPRAEDAGPLAAHLGRFEITRTLSRVPHPYTVEMARDWIAGNLEAGDPTRVDLMIERDGRLTGAVGFHKLDAIPELGYWLAEDQWGQGLMSEAVSAAIAWLFEATAHDRLRSGCFETNPASLRIQHKLGFTVTGPSTVHCLASRQDLPHIDTELLRGGFKPLGA